MYDFEKNTADLNIFLDRLIMALDLKKAPPEKQAELRQQIGRQMNEIILENAGLHLPPHVMESVAQEAGTAKNPLEVLQKMIQESPETQAQILLALDDFYDEMLETFKVLAHQ